MLCLLRFVESFPDLGPQVMPRLFTALEIPPHVAQSLAMMRGGLPGARWIDPENYHLTLRFIGVIGHADRAADGVAGRARPAAAPARARARGPQIYATCDAGAVARFVEPPGRRVSQRPRPLPLSLVRSLALRAVLVA